MISGSASTTRSTANWAYCGYSFNFGKFDATLIPPDFSKISPANDVGRAAKNDPGAP